MIYDDSDDSCGDSKAGYGDSDDSCGDFHGSISSEILDDSDDFPVGS